MKAQHHRYPNWNNSLQVDQVILIWHIILIPNKPSVLWLLIVVCLAEKQQIPILVFGLIQPALKPMIYNTWGEHVNNYTNDMVSS